MNSKLTFKYIPIFNQYFTGIIFFELLTIIKIDKWSDTITELKKLRFPANNNLDNMEKRLIKRILTNNPQDQPKSISEVTEVINYQINSELLPAKG